MKEPLGERTHDQIARTYRVMARVGHRPEASNGDLKQEAQAFADSWYGEEDEGVFDIGVCKFDYRPATILAVEAARLMCGAEGKRALRLLKLAVEELERAREKFREATA